MKSDTRVEINIPICNSLLVILYDCTYCVTVHTVCMLYDSYSIHIQVLIYYFCMLKITEIASTL
jgi:hypothetical protein